MIGAAALVVGMLTLTGGCSGSSSSGGTSPTTNPGSQSTTTANSPDTQAICSDINALQQSVETLRGLQLDKDSIQTAATTVSGMQQQLDKLVTDAQAQYKSQVDLVRASYQGVKTSVAAAKEAPNKATFAAVRTAVSGLADSLKKMRSDVGGC